MQNIIPTEDSKLKLRQNISIWDVKDEPELDLETPVDFKSADEAKKILRSQLTGRVGRLVNLSIRIGLSAYRLINTPMERAEENETSFRYGDDVNNTVLHQSVHVDLQFDINAEVEPVPYERTIVMDYGDMDAADFEDLNEVDLVAVGRCKGLKRQPLLVEDMQPTSSLNLEYSYRPMDIGQFWAGPSHWKFRQSRRTQLSIGARSTINNISSEQVGTVGQQKKVVRKKKIEKKKEASYEDVLSIDEDVVGQLVKITENMRGTQLSALTLAKKWDAKKHKLPNDFKIPFDYFDKFEHAGSISIRTNRDTTFTGNDENDIPYNYNNENDRDYCSRIADVQSDTETETNTDMGQMDNLEFDNIDMPPPPAPVDEIPDVFIGAPEKIEKISIAFARRAKVVDMKQLKGCSWTLINNKHNSDPLHNPKFSDTLKELPKVLNKTMAENMSMPLAFYAILHLCNDKGLRLNQSDEKLNDFDIEFLQMTIWFLCILMPHGKHTKT